MLDLRQLEAFRAVMLAGSVTGAGDLLGLTQPTISKLIAQLERRIAMKLFDRERGRLVPRAEAQAFLTQVDKIFKVVEETARQAQQLARGQVGRLRVVAIPPLALGILPQAITQFSREHADVEIALSVRGSSYIGEWVETQQADIGLFSHTGPIAGLETEIFYRAPAICVLPRSHPLTGKRKLTPQDLAGQRFIGLGRETAFHHRVDRVFVEAGVERHALIHAGQSAIACAMVAQGAGVTVVDPLSALHSFEIGGVVLRRFSPEVMFEARIVTSPLMPRSLLAEAFLLRLAEARKDLDLKLQAALRQSGPRN
jgi:DNA-binding transcriptional LysR family regulator